MQIVETLDKQATGVKVQKRKWRMMFADGHNLLAPKNGRNSHEGPQQTSLRHHLARLKMMERTFCITFIS